MGAGARPAPAPPRPSPWARLITALYSETRAARVPPPNPTENQALKATGEIESEGQSLHLLFIEKKLNYGEK